METKSNETKSNEKLLQELLDKEQELNNELHDSQARANQELETAKAEAESIMVAAKAEVEKLASEFANKTKADGKKSHTEVLKQAQNEVEAFKSKVKSGTDSAVKLVMEQIT